MAWIIKRKDSGYVEDVAGRRYVWEDYDRALRWREDSGLGGLEIGELQLNPLGVWGLLEAHAERSGYEPSQNVP